MDQQPDLTALYIRFHKPLRKWLERRCQFSGVDPDDVAQEVFVRLLRYPHQQGKEDGRGGYIFHIASNVASEYGERSVNQRPHAPVHSFIEDERDEHAGDCSGHTSNWVPSFGDVGESLYASEAGEPEVVMQSASVGAFVRASVATMPARVQQCLMMFVMHELPYKEIARRLDISERMVMRDMQHAYEILREKLA